MKKNSALQYGGFSVEIFLRSFRGSSSQRPNALRRVKQTMFHQSGLSTHSANPTSSHTPPPALKEATERSSFGTNQHCKRALSNHQRSPISVVKGHLKTDLCAIHLSLGRSKHILLSNVWDWSRWCSSYQASLCVTSGRTFGVRIKAPMLDLLKLSKGEKLKLQIGKSGLAQA